MRFKSTIAALLLLAGCVTLRQDPNPSPVDLEISQARLEFSGCEQDNAVGMVACKAPRTVSAVTEFPGTLLAFTSGGGCSLYKEQAVTSGLTEIPIPEVDASGQTCAVTVFYLPQYPKAARSTYPIRGLTGEVIYQYASSHANLMSARAIRLSEILRVELPSSVVRGAFIGRQMADPVTFTGNVFRYQPIRVGTDLIQMKLFWEDGSNSLAFLPVNYFSVKAVEVSAAVTKKGKKLHVEFPDTVSVITKTGDSKPCSTLYQTLDDSFSGFVRAYTVQGRTSVLKFESGELKWIK